MASNPSFDISTGADLQEVDNAVNQARKEIQQRYDFKGAKAEIDFDRTKAELKLAADDEFRMDALTEVLQGKTIKRGVPVKNLHLGDVEITGTTARRTITLTQGIAGDIAKKIQKAIKDGGFKKVQAAIQGDAVRITGAKRDDLQAAMALIKKDVPDLPLTFNNFRD